MKNIGKYFIWIVILALVLIGVYSVLPEYPHSVIKSVFQPTFDAVAKERVMQVQNLKNPELEVTYGNILANGSRSQAWVYEKKETEEIVTFYGRGAYINIKDIPDHDDYLYTSTNVKFEFIIQGGKLIDIKAYIGSNEQDEVIRATMLRQLYNGERV